VLSRTGEVIRRVETGCAILLLTAIVILVAIASIARSVGSPIIWSVEIAQLCFVWLCMFSADLALQSDRHFGLSILSDSLPPGRRRTLDLFNRVILIALLVFLLYYAWGNMILMYPRLIGATQMHGSYIHASIVVGLCLLLRTMISQTYTAWRGALPEDTGSL
jgi:TRAP-type transport system small permease protein|tara:strand:+ start:2503 stop:2991 length:489 start_codon:yes stop_codon:yes gene_type:complete